MRCLNPSVSTIAPSILGEVINLPETIIYIPSTMHIVQDRAEECDEFQYSSTQHEKKKLMDFLQNFIVAVYHCSAHSSYMIGTAIDTPSI
jgi:hypothetical protein